MMFTLIPRYATVIIRTPAAPLWARLAARLWLWWWPFGHWPIQIDSMHVIASDG